MDDEIVLPSDPEELEEYEAERDLEAYLHSRTPAITRNLELVRGLILARTEARTETRTDILRHSDVEDGDLGREGTADPPRKRVKLSHSLPDGNVAGSSTPSTPSTPRSQPRIAEDILNITPARSVASYLRAEHSDLASPEAAATNTLEASIRQTPERNPSSSHARESPDPDQEHGDEAMIPLHEHDERPSSQSYAVPSPQAPRRRYPASPDPLLLFTQADITPTLSHNHSSDPEDDLPVAGPSRRQRSPPPPSPAARQLPSSSPLSSLAPSRQPSPSGGPSAEQAPTSDAEVAPGADGDNAVAAQLQQAENASRYPLRERTNLQKQPYYEERVAYQKLLHRRGIPEAVVKKVSPPRRHRSREHSVEAGHASSSDAEVDPAQFEDEDSDGDRRSRRRVRSGTREEVGSRGRRSRTTSEGASARRRVQTPPRRADFPAVEPAASASVTANANGPLTASTSNAGRAARDNTRFSGLYMNISSSDGEPEEELAPVRTAKGKGKQRATEDDDADGPKKKKRRRRRFPMRRSPSPVRSPPARRSSRPPHSPLPRLPRRARPSLPDSSDVEVLSSTHSPSRSRSRPPSADPWGVPDDLRQEDRGLTSDASGPPESSSLPDLNPDHNMDVDDNGLGLGNLNLHFEGSQPRDDFDFGAPAHSQDHDAGSLTHTPARRERSPSHAKSSPINVDSSGADDAAEPEAGSLSDDLSDPPSDVDPASLPDDEFHRIYRRQFLQLYRMYPPKRARLMILGDLKKQAPPRAVPQRRRQSADPDAPIQPGRARIRVGSGRDIVIRGDSESEDEPRRTPSPSPSPSPRPSSSFNAGPLHRSSQTSVSAGRRSVLRTFSEGVISISSDEDEDEGSQADDESEDGVEFVNGPTNFGRSGAAREGTLVDYMLNRTGGRRKRNQETGGSRRRQHGLGGGGGSERNDSSRGAGRGGRALGSGSGGSRHKRSVVNVQMKAGGSRRHTMQHKRPSASSRTRLVVGGARKYGHKQQSLLNFQPIDAGPVASPDRDSSPSPARRPAAPSASGPSVPSLDITVGQPKSGSSKPAWKKARNRTRDRVYFLKPHISTVVSGARGQHEYRTTVLEQEVTESERRAQAIMHYPLPVYEPPKRKAVRQPGARRQRVRSEVLGPSGDGGDDQRDMAEKKSGVSVNLGITKLPSGIAFAETTYLGRGQLQALLKPPVVLDEPSSGYIGNTRVSISMAPTDFAEVIREVVTEVLGKLEEATADGDVFDDWQRFLQVTRPWLAWFLRSASLDELELVQATLRDQAKRIYTLVEDRFAVRADASYANLLLLQLQWAAVEFLYQIRPVRDPAPSLMEDEELVRHVKLLIQHLWACNLDQHLSELWPLGVRHLDYSKPIYRVAELWVCLIHLVEDGGGRGSFWSLLKKSYQEFNFASLSGPKAKAGEALWTTVYSFIALSQFSSRGSTTSTPLLGDAWGLVVLALGFAPLSANPTTDPNEPERALKKRDRYIKVLLSRCVWLHNHWQWTLGTVDALLTLKSLLSIFRSRRFGNLLHEKNDDFSDFLKDHKLALLYTQQEGDSAFTGFLKLVVQASATIGSNSTMSGRVKQILEAAVPLSSVQFHRSRPASVHESSMFYNRISAVATAICLEPKPENVKYRISHARRYVDFKETDRGTRSACIRGAMCLAILLQHFELPLDDILGWLDEMTDVLVAEYELYKDEAAKRARNDVVTCIQMVLASVRRIIERPRMDDEPRTLRYPDPALLRGHWVTKAFSLSGNLASAMNAPLEMRMLVQSFLKARSAVVPRRQPQPTPVVIQEDSQEYGDDDFDFDDPEVLAALGVADRVNDDAGAAQDKVAQKIKEEETCKVIEEHVIKAVFRILCRDLSHRRDQLETDKWVECWAGCAEVLVANGRRDWGYYFSYASDAWKYIIPDPATLRRRLLHLSTTVLKLDPLAYAAAQDHFLEVLFTCLAVQHPDLEPEYVALVFSLDGLQHPLLRDIVCPPSGNTNRFELSRVEFVDRRISFLKCILTNLENSLDYWNLSESTETSLRLVAKMLSTMQEIHSGLDLSGRNLYAPFCSGVLALLSSKPRVAAHSSLTEYVSWLRSLSTHRHQL